MSTKEELLAAAAEWERLAKEATERAAYDRSIGLGPPGGTSPGDHKAKSYRDTAAALRLQAETGVYHCSCHLRPLAEHHKLKEAR